MGANGAPLRKPDVTRIVSISKTDSDPQNNGVKASQTRTTTSWSGPLEELVGFSPAEAADTEDWWLERIHPDDRETVRDRLKQLLSSVSERPFAAESRIWSHDYRFKHAGGEYILLSDRAIVYRDAQGHVTQLESIVFDNEQRGKQRKEFAKMFEAQNHLALIANNTQSGIFMMDPQGYCIYMNSAAEKITGFTFEEIYDYTFHASVHSCRPDGAVFPIQDCPVFCHQQAGTEAKNEAEIFVHKDGHHYDIEYSVSPIGNYATGGAVIEFRDVTEQKKIERERLNAVLMNEQQSIQIKADNVHKANMTSFVSFVCHELRNPLQGVTSSAEFLLDTLQRMEMLTQQMLSAKTSPTSTDELVGPTANLDVSTASKSRVLPAPSTTDNPNPTTPNTQIAELQDLISEAKTLVSQVTTCADHQALITNNVLDLSRLDAGKVELSPEIADVRAAGRQTILMMTAKAAHKALTLTLKDDDERAGAAPIYLKIDVTLLRQVLLNLVSNAIKFTSAGGTITLGFRVSGASPSPGGDGQSRMTLHSSVADDGMGMTAAEQTGLFERFSQANRRVAQLYGGSGLGLSISRELVRAMGGDMAVRSAPGKGSVFSFTSLHHVPGADELRRYLASSSATSTSSSSSATPMTMMPRDGAGTLTSVISMPPAAVAAAVPKFRTVGVAEDNPINLRILATYLRKLGYRAVTCTNGREVVDAVCATGATGANGGAAGTKIDCCILDMSMPVMDGLEAARRIRAFETASASSSSVSSTSSTSSTSRQRPAAEVQVRRMPLIALSGNALKEQVAEALAAGISDYLVKPCKQADLARRLAYWEGIVHSGAPHEPAPAADEGISSLRG